MKKTIKFLVDYQLEDEAPDQLVINCPNAQDNTIESCFAWALARELKKLGLNKEEVEEAVEHSIILEVKRL